MNDELGNKMHEVLKCLFDKKKHFLIFIKARSGNSTIYTKRIVLLKVNKAKNNILSQIWFDECN